MPRSKNLRARSWLEIGGLVQYWYEAKIGFDVVILKRGREPQPGREVIKAPGHVGFFGGWIDNDVYLLGGNQGNKVCLQSYSKDKILGIRRLHG